MAWSDMRRVGADLVFALPLTTDDGYFQDNWEKKVAKGDSPAESGEGWGMMRANR